MAEIVFNAPTFVCPLCQVYSQQTWTAALEQRPGLAISPYSDLYWATCLNCKERTIWYKQRLVAPLTSSAPPPNPDMPDDIRTDFEEARAIVERSPRSAAGLLRLCIQKLCIELGEPGSNLNTDIGSLVALGLPAEVQQAFDAVRIVGNSQLHPDNDGINLQSNPKGVSLLFLLVNLIVENQISLPRKVGEFYKSLPESALAQVERRTDKNKALPAATA